MDIVFLLSHIPNPRFNKRIQLFKGENRVFLICWDKITKNLWEIVHEDISNFIIKEKANYSKPIMRIIPTIRFAYKAIKKLKQIQPKYIYTANVDMLFIAWVYSLFKKNKPSIIYEIADLNKLIIDDPKKLIKKVVRYIAIVVEKILTKKVKLLVLTSMKFYEIYYSKFFPLEKIIYMPNMPNLNVFADYKKTEKKGFTVGFIGIIRYKEQMKMLINAAQECKVKLLFAGSSIDNEIASICENKPLIEFYGKFDFDTEIANLYNKCDCIYSVYDADMNNVKVALPNKLYEAIYCELPIIVAKGTYLGEIVEDMGVGIAISHNDETELIHAIRRLSTDKEYYNSFVYACHNHKDKINIDVHNQNLLGRILA